MKDVSPQDVAFRAENICIASPTVINIVGIYCDRLKQVTRFKLRILTFTDAVMYK